jgi:bifunctional non-homologous end joining protein LigD
VRNVGAVVHEVLQDLKMAGWPKTSGKRGLHVYVRIKPRWTYEEVRRCALALAREVERRAPRLATTAWWKEERHGVFIDYNQNARDRTIAGAYSVRPTSRATVSAPIEWRELAECEPGDFTLTSMKTRFSKVGDPHRAIDRRECSLDALLELAARQEREGHGEAPWPPHYRKARGEPPRVQPSRRRSSVKQPRGRGRTPSAARRAS